MLIAGNQSASKETYRINLVKNECVRDADLAQGISCYSTLSPVQIGGEIYFVGFDRTIQVYRRAEKKWEIV